MEESKRWSLDMLQRPYKLPRRRKFKILTDYMQFYEKERFFFTIVNAYSSDDALSQFKKVVVYCGEPIVEEIFS